MPKSRTQDPSTSASSTQAHTASRAARRETPSPYARPANVTVTANRNTRPQNVQQQQPSTSATSSSDILRFFSASKHVPPGKGPGEFVRDPSLYTSLATIPNWRRVLSNFDASTPFRWRNWQWASIEHAFQGAKMGLVDLRAMAAFALDSTPQDRGNFPHIGRQSALDARNSRKLLVLGPPKVREWNQTSAGVMQDIARAKYRVCDVGKRVLVATRNAQLWHAGPRIAAVRFSHLEQIRDGLRESHDEADRERLVAEQLGDELFEPIASGDESR